MNGLPRVAIVGAGHAGLCVVEALQRRGIRPVVYDDADRLGDVWRRRYDDLILNTRGDESAIPGVDLPDRIGDWPGKEQWADHIEHAAAVLDVDRRTSRVERVRRHGDEWRLEHTDGTDTTDVVVVATGRNRLHVVPPWDGVEESPIEVLHAAEFRRPDPFLGRSVLVVGAGNSGVEIAHLCAAASVETTLAMHRRPVFARREFFGTDLTSAAKAAKRFPDRVVDLSGRILQLALFGRLKRWGIGPPQMRLSNVAEASGATLDSGFVDDVKAGRVRVIDAVDRLDGEFAVTTSGERHRCDVLIAATGYDPGLSPLLPDDALVDGWPACRTAPWMSAPGLYTAGLNPATLTAFHPDFIVEADEIGADIQSRFAEVDPTTTR